MDLFIHIVLRAIEVAGIAVIVIGLGVATARFVKNRNGGKTDGVFQRYRADVGKAILLGLEFLVAADIIATVAVKPDLDSVLILGGIVLIRTFLSFSLEVEIEGRWPWQQAKAKERAAKT